MLDLSPHKVGNFGNGQTVTTVSKQWLSRTPDQKFLSLDDLHQSVNARREQSIESTITLKSVEVIAPEIQSRDDTHKLSLGLPDGREVSPSHWTFGQLCQQAGAPTKYLRQLPTQIGADALNYSLRFTAPREQMMLLDDGVTARAITSPTYGRIFDADVVQAVQNIAGNGTGDSNWKVPGTLDWSSMTYNPHTPVTAETTTLFASDRDVFMFLVDDLHPIEVGKLPDGSPDLMFRGFYVSNSEVGSGSLRIAAFYLRAVCCNRILWGVENFQEVAMRHSRYAPDRFLEEARPALESYAQGSSQTLIEGVKKAKAAKVASDDDDALAFLQARSFSKAKAALILEAVEREEQTKARTVWDMAQGITAVARKTENTDTRLEMEMQARKLLDKVAA